MTLNAKSLAASGVLQLPGEFGLQDEEGKAYQLVGQSLTSNRGVSGSYD